MFGSTYHYEKQPRILADGDYVVTIGKPFETQVGGYPVLRFPFTVNGEKEPVVPNYFDLFDVLDPNDPEKVKLFNKLASRIKACFKLGGNFEEANYIRWYGSMGKIRVEKSKAGFVNVVQFYRAELTTEEESVL